MYFCVLRYSFLTKMRKKVETSESRAERERNEEGNVRRLTKDGPGWLKGSLYIVPMPCCERRTLSSEPS